MNDQKKIEEYLDNRLRNARLVKPSEEFTSGLMFKIQEESKLAKEESKRDRIAKYIIGSFSSLVIVVTVIIGILSGSHPSSNVTKNFSIEPTIETSNNYLNQFFTFIQNIFSKVLDLLGLSFSSSSFGIVVGLLIAVTLFLLADKLLVRGKLKSRQSI